MADPRFFTNVGPFTLRELAARLGGTLSDGAPADLAITDIAMLEEAGPTDLGMFCDSRYREAFDSTHAGAVVTDAHFATARAEGGPHLIILDSPRLAFAEAAWLFYPRSPESALIEHRIEEATIGVDCRISPNAVIASGASVGARTLIGPGAVIGPGVVIGDDCIIGPNATITHAIIGDRVQIYSGVSIGVQGFGFVPGPKGVRRVPQLGRVVIEDDVEIGANTVVDRGAVGDTRIGRGTVIDNLCHIGHNVRIGRFCLLAGQVGIAGSSELGDGVMIGGQAGIKDHMKVGARAQIAAGTGVIRDVAAGAVVAGYPALPIRQWHRQNATLQRASRRENDPPAE